MLLRYAIKVRSARILYKKEKEYDEPRRVGAISRLRQLGEVGARRLLITITCF